jgi:hypothetical protein
MTSSIVALQAAGMLLQDIPRIKFCVLFAGMPVGVEPKADMILFAGMPVAVILNSSQGLALTCQ